MERLVGEIERSFAEVEERLQDPAILGDQRQLADLGRRHSRLSEANELAAAYRDARLQIDDAGEMLETETDPETRTFLLGELETAREQLPVLEEKIRLAMVERDPADDKDVIVEIRAGTGGEEAALFAADLYKMLTRYAERRGFKHQVLASDPSELGRLPGHHVLDRRRRRLLACSSGSRACTASSGCRPPSRRAASTPRRPPSRCCPRPRRSRSCSTRRSSRSRPSAAGARAASRSTRPTPPCASRTCRRASRWSARTSARSSRTRSARCASSAPASTRCELEKAQSELDEARRSQIGTGARSEKMRTYNYPQSRVTDHRVKVTSHNLSSVMLGELEVFTDALQADDNRKRLRGGGAQVMQLDAS